MPDDARGSQAAENAGPDIDNARGTTDGNSEVLPRQHPETAQPGRRTKAGMAVVAAVMFTAVGFGGGLLIRDQIAPPRASSVIPSPPARNQQFVEDDNGTGADSQANILQATVPGLVSITSARGSGAGVVLTPSGLVLTSAQVAAAGATVSARLLPSGHSYRARVVGSDPARDLTLLQLEGGGTFHPVAIGNARGVAAGDAAIAVGASTSGRAFTPVIGNLDDTNATAVIGGHRLTRLLKTTAQLIPGQSAGGPLVNLSGQVVGVNLTGSAQGATATSYAITINDGLSIARQLRH
jgi:putative serine protease PepD